MSIVMFEVDISRPGGERRFIHKSLGPSCYGNINWKTENECSAKKGLGYIRSKTIE